MIKNNENKTIVVGMSGGVDSSVVAVMLKNQGYNVVGLFMHNWEEKDENDVCTSQQDFEDVKRVCGKIGIPYFTVNYAQEYLDRVFKDFVEEYKAGRTPNPDVLCNREIKFGPLLDKAIMLGADFVATGHYAKVYEKNGLYYLAKSKDLNKDQSYFLHQLTQEQLKHAKFPLSEISKPDVRKIAKEYDLSTAAKKDSTGICFIGEKRFREFLKQFIPAKSGDILDLSGKKVGRHDGVMFYTLGQRRGLNIGGSAQGNGDRWFVIKKDVKNNILYVNQGECEELYSSGLMAGGINWIPNIPAETEFECFAKFRYRQSDQKVKVKIIDSEKAEVIFAEKQRAITPGQYVVFYDKDENCLGGGKIEKSF